ncbi:NADP-dependent oxidoreductase [Sporosarcina sp. P37]|uniref:NADP-dependent oxidoreductase n=1 Tax=unclassified Sporosarcina TaxID=2647733 RepID=UPI000A17D1B0|nr:MULTISPECIES: NADP-dependent oxidoreductase [unclassified Sporosarcina]ARK23722.1 NADP-dependent oxidoreductase [Sporosarcina sp. P37]PID18868.1 NADP-dependent oxidoreductase [Sporosarcina sp. P35]
MTEKTQREIHLASRPVGLPTMETFDFVEKPIPVIEENEVLVRTLYVSVDPYMRGRMMDAKSYIPPFKLHEAITGGVVGEITESNSEAFQAGDLVVGNLNWAEYTAASEKDVRKIDPNIAPITAHLGILGMTGLTAYFGLLDIGRPQKGETVVVSGAAGAVGSAVGQIAKMKGASVIGIAGSQEKIDYLKNELGFDEAVNYKLDSFEDDLKKAAADGVDVYFDNVGGEVTDAVFTLLNKHARIALCGAISSYNKVKDSGPRLQSQMIKTSALMKGFTVGDYSADFAKGAADLGKWLAEEKLTYEETIVEGFENIPEAFLGLFEGKNLGKLLVKVADPTKQ